MFSLISGFIQWYFAKPTFKLLIIGDERSGKSTYLEQLKLIYTGHATPLDFILPTSGLNCKLYLIIIVTKFKYNETELLFWDLSGKEGLRKLWEKYYEDIDGLIYMLDCSSPEIENSIKILNNFVLNNPNVQKVDIPILILINKIDLIELDKDKIKKIYDAIDYHQLTDKHFLVKDISALKNIHLDESIRWLFNSMMDNIRDDENDNTNYINLV